MLSIKNIHRAPGSSFLGGLMILVALAHWWKAGQWTDGHSAVVVAGSGLFLAPDPSLKPKAQE